MSICHPLLPQQKQPVTKQPHSLHTSCAAVAPGRPTAAACVTESHAHRSSQESNYWLLAGSLAGSLLHSAVSNHQQNQYVAAAALPCQSAVNSQRCDQREHAGVGSSSVVLAAAAIVTAAVVGAPAIDE
jgi:hypothetical protein